MPGLRDFLMRFRPAGSPGRASAVGVPADRSAELSSERTRALAEAEAAECLAQSEREATLLRRRARERMAPLVENTLVLATSRLSVRSRFRSARR